MSRVPLLAAGRLNAVRPSVPASRLGSPHRRNAIWPLSTSP